MAARSPALALLVAAAMVAGAGLTPGGTHAAQSAKSPTRIVSLIPAVTEMLYAIGAGPQVVGVSSFDSYPPDVKSVARVGALLDPNLERILALRPDLVAAYRSQTELRQQLARAGIATFTYSHGGLADVTSTIRELGQVVGRPEEASKVARHIEERIDATRRRIAGKARPRTAIIFGREPGTLRGIYASGGVGFIHDMVAAAGGANVFSDVKREAVQATTELILTRRPDVILELRPSLAAAEVSRETGVWRALSAVPAVKAGRIHILTDSRTVVPGPRIAEGLELIARTLHPDPRK